MSDRRHIHLILSLCAALMLGLRVSAQEATLATPTTLSGTQWQFVNSSSVGIETPLIPGSTITLAFDETQVSGESGCNHYSGTYTLPTEKTITISPLASTKRACVGDGLMEQEQFYLGALQAAQSFSRRGNLLTVYDTAGHILHFLRIAPLEDSIWTLTAYGPRGAETPVLDDSTITLAFQDGSALGTGGCNSYSGSYKHDAATAALTFNGIAITDILCTAEGVMGQESAYIDALRTAVSYEISAAQLMIIAENGQGLMFNRMMPLQETVWQLVSYGDREAPTPALQGHPVTLTMETGGKAEGHNTCNYYGGTYTLDAEASTISFAEVFTTLMACLDEGVMEQETLYLDALGDVIGYDLTDNTLTLFYGEGQALVYRPAYQTEAQK